MNSHRVFVIWVHPLFVESLRLLLKSTEIQWVGAESAADQVLPKIQQLHPDTILVEVEENGNLPFHVIDLMESSPYNVRIFRLSLANNDLRIYSREKRTVMQAGDLLNLIRESE